VKISVIVVTRNEGAELRRTVENFRDTLPAKSEVVIVDDASTDGSTRGLRGVIKTPGIGVARARNLGATHSKGDLIVWADAHIRLDKFWWQPLADVLEDRNVAGAAPGVTHLPATRNCGYGLELTGPDLDARWLARKADTPFAAPIIPGCCFMMRRAVFDATGGWDTGMHHRGGVDNEGSVRFWMLGYDLLIVPQVVIRHRFRESSPYHVGWPEYIHNRLRLAFAHFSPPRLAKVVRALQDHEAFGEAMALLVEGDISLRRKEMLARRTRTDDWYFERFGHEW
jgi:GT2 family glycosyltransferase